MYYILAVIWILQGGYQLAQALGVIPNPLQELGMGSAIGILGVIQIGLGLGLLLEQTWAQFLIKILSWISIGLGIIFLPMVMLSKNWVGPLLEDLFRMTLAGFQIYIINCVGDA